MVGHRPVGLRGPTALVILCAKLADYFIFEIFYHPVACLNNNLVLPVVLYGCETWSEGGMYCIFGVFDNIILRRIDRRNKEEATRRRRTLHSEVFHNLYFSSNIRAIKSRI
jgi:hypothetical protein